MKQSILHSAFLFVAFFCAFPFQSNASHGSGAEITYQCTTTPGIFEVTLIIYRRCDGGTSTLCPNTCGAACSQTLELRGADGSCSSSLFANISLSLASVRDININSYCPLSKNVCNNMGCVTAGTYTPAIERYEFKGFANIGANSGIPASCCNVRMAWNYCCRNSYINTGAADQNMYVDAVINRCLSVSPWNSSPTLTNDPLAIICGGESIIFNNGAVDPDLDSLSYSFTPALQAYGTPVQYNPPFAFHKPMPWTGNATGLFPQGIHCDPVNGDIMFLPPNSGSGVFAGVVAIEIKQWKLNNGVMTVVGSTHRDVLMLIRSDCIPNNSPQLRTNPPEGNNPLLPKTNWTICAGEQLCFTVTAKDTDFNPSTLSPSDTTILSWNGSLAAYGATFTPDYDASKRGLPDSLGGGPREDRYKFCWTPTGFQGSTTPYYFTVSAKDKRCPNPGLVTRSFSILVGIQPNVTITKINKKCGKWQVQYTNNTPAKPITSSLLEIAKSPGDTAFYSYNNVTSSPDITFTKPGKYLVKLTVQSGTGCPNMVFDTLLVDTQLSIFSADTLLTCEGIPVTLSATAVNGKTPYQYKWYNSYIDSAAVPLNMPNLTIADFTVTPQQTRTYYLLVRDSIGCLAGKNVLVSLKNHVQTIAKSNLTCFGSNNGKLTVEAVDPNQSYQYKLDSGSFQSSNIFNNLTPGNYTITVKDSANCNSSQTVTITQPALLKDTLVSVKNETCAGMNNASIAIHATGGTKPYRYSLDSILFTGDTLYSNLLPKAYTLHVLDSNNCYATAIKTIVAADSLRYTVTTKAPTCATATNGEIKISATGGKRPYLHKLGSSTFLADSVFKSLSAKTHAIIVRDANGCEVSFNQVIIAPPPMQGTITVQHVACFGGTGKVLLTGNGGTPPYLYRTIGTGVYFASGEFNNLVSANYSYEIKDSLNCTQNISAAVNQPAAINLTVVSKPTTCFGNTDGKLIVSTSGGVRPYKFSTDSILFTTDSVLTNLTGGFYAVYIRDSMGCVKKSIPVSISHPAKVTATAVLTQISCNGRSDGQISVTPKVGKTPFLYSLNGNAFGTTNTFANLSPGSYSVIVKDSASCKDTLESVLVNPAPIAVGNISGPINSHINGVETYIVTSQPGLHYKWTTKKGIVASDDTSSSAIVRWDTAGVGRVAVTIYKDISCGDTASIAVSIGATGLYDLSRSWGLSVFPNPAKDILYITLKQLPDHKTLQLFDVQGRSILKQDLKLSQQLNIENLTPGIYILKIGEWSGQVVKE